MLTHMTRQSHMLLTYVALLRGKGVTEKNTRSCSSNSQSVGLLYFYRQWHTRWSSPRYPVAAAITLNQYIPFLLGITESGRETTLKSSPLLALKWTKFLMHQPYVTCKAEILSQVCVHNLHNKKHLACTHTSYYNSSAHWKEFLASMCP